MPHVACKASGLVTEVVGERIDADAIRLARPGVGTIPIVLALGDVSGVRALTEEDERRIT